MTRQRSVAVGRFSSCPLENQATNRHYDGIPDGRCFHVREDVAPLKRYGRQHGARHRAVSTSARAWHH